MATRRAHIKSRSGCRECKRRKVKCDERLPSCFNCSRRGMECSLASPLPHSLDIDPVRKTSPGSAHGVAYDETLLGGVCTDPLPASSVEFSGRSLELLHHYSTVTADTLAFRPDMQHVWRIVVPELGYRSRYLWHGILSVAALHKAHLLPAVRDKFLDAAAYHQVRGMEGFRNALADVSDDNWKPAFCFASTVVISAFSTPGQSGDTMAEILKLFALIRGMRSSSLEGDANLAGTRLSPWSEGIWIVPEDDDDSYNHRDPPLDHSALPSETFRAFRRLFAFYRTNLPESSRADYEFATVQLRKAAILIAHAGIRAEIGMLLFFPYVIPTNILLDIQDKNPHAMVLLTYFALLLSVMERNFWYLNGWAKRLLRAVEPHLADHPKLLRLTKWPRQTTTKLCES